MSRQTKQLWIHDADQMLADGEWHDGFEWIHAVEKKITPGVAIRHTEGIRARQAARRHGVTLAEAPERSKPLSKDAQIAAGKRDMLRTFVQDRVRQKMYEVDPWPMPAEGLRQGGWKLRRILRYTPSLLEVRYKVSAEQIRKLILEDPPLNHLMLGGSRLQIFAAELPELDRRVEIYKEGSRGRRQQSAQQRWADWQSREPEFISATDLSRRSGMSGTTVAKLLDEHPQLGATQSGRVRRLPVANLDAWDEVVAAYRSTDAERKAAQRQAASLIAAEQRRRRQGSHPLG